jgi:indolepyruvate ferredoxin oxidoreductase
MLTGKDSQGRPKKREFGAWVIPLFRLLARMKPLRGTALDIFGYSAERRMERALIAEYEGDLSMVLASVTPAKQAIAKELAELPLTIRGFGPVKQANAEKAAKRRAALLVDWHQTGGGTAIAAE